MLRFIFFLTIVVGLAACDKSRVYETNQDFKNGIWKSTDTLRFDFNIADTSKRYNVILNVRNTIDFETVRLFINYNLADSNKVLRTRLIEQNLFDRKTGEPFGESGLRNIYTHHFTVEPSIKFSSPGTYQIKLNHMMRVDELAEILSIGIRVEEVTSN